MTAGFFRMKKLRGATKILVASRHNKRTTQSEVGTSAHIDPTRTGQNLTLHGPDTPEQVAGLAKALMASAGVTSLKVTAVVGLEVVYSLPTAWSGPMDQFFRDCLAWTAENFGGLANVLSADVHLDEAAPHMHVLILPLVGGRMNGSSLFGNRPRLLALHEGFHAAIGARYGLAKGSGRLTGLAKEKTAQNVIQRLRGVNDAALASCLWAELREAIEANPTPFAAALGLDPVLGQPKRLRTMAAIFTSKGKGKPDADPIGEPIRPIGKGPKPRPLSCVGAASTLPTQDGTQHNDGRTVDRSDCDFSGFPDDMQAAPDWSEKGAQVR